MFTVRVQVQSRSQIPNASGVRIESIFVRVSPLWMVSPLCESSQYSTVDDRVERGTNQLDFHKIESIFSTVDDRVDRGTNQFDFQKIEAMHVHSTTDDRVQIESILLTIESI